MQWPSLKRPIQTTKQLLVEGRTPEIFFREWIEALGLKDKVEVRDYGSLTDLGPYLKVFTSYQSFRDEVISLAVVRDAKDKPAASRFRVCFCLPCVQGSQSSLSRLCRGLRHRKAPHGGLHSS